MTRAAGLTGWDWLVDFYYADDVNTQSYAEVYISPQQTKFDELFARQGIAVAGWRLCR